MANAVDDVKAAAHIVLEQTCEEDGVACFLEQQFLSTEQRYRA
jgi:hydroxymethylpyrimidine pyrophosphatase-like HAD family hydrolase